MGEKVGQRTTISAPLARDFVNELSANIKYFPSENSWKMKAKLLSKEKLDKK